MLCCLLCSLLAFQASNQRSLGLGRRDEAGPGMHHHFDDMAPLALSPAVLQPDHLPGPGREDGPSRSAASSVRAGLGLSALQRPAVTWAVSTYMKQLGKRKSDELCQRTDFVNDKVLCADVVIIWLTHHVKLFHCHLLACSPFIQQILAKHLSCA